MTFPIKKVGIVGAGTMGAGIAISAVASGYSVMLMDRDAQVLSVAEAKLTRYLTRQVEKARMAAETATKQMGAFTTSTNLEELSGSHLIIEAVFEKLEVKFEVFSRLNGFVDDTVFLATNTSALKVGDIAKALRHRHRFCGLHYFSPAEINPVVEVIRGSDTSDETIFTILPFLSTCRKRPVLCRDQSGFALNRFFCPYTNEAVRCLDEGLGNSAEIDAVARSVLGVALGPFAVMNIVKPRIMLDAIRSLGHLGEFYTAASGLEQLGETGEMWKIASGEQAVSPTKASIISDRLRGAIFSSVVEEIAEEVAVATDIDAGAEGAFTFASGPVKMMRSLGYAEVVRLIKITNPSAVRLVDRTLV